MRVRPLNRLIPSLRFSNWFPFLVICNYEAGNDAIILEWPYSVSIRLFIIQGIDFIPKIQMRQDCADGEAKNYLKAFLNT